jgi:hypothetical protein
MLSRIIDLNILLGKITEKKPIAIADCFSDGFKPIRILYIFTPETLPPP